MAKRKINWTDKANTERLEILEYWINRNKSKAFSIKLYKLFVETIRKVAEHPTIGKKTNFEENVRLKIVRDYLIFYQYDDNQIKILSVWDGNRDQQKIQLQ